MYTKEQILGEYQAVRNNPVEGYTPIQFAGLALACNIDKLTVPDGWRADEIMAASVKRYEEADMLLAAIREV
jgi:hypothetical protein